jgi:hypothetical protein
MENRMAYRIRRKVQGSVVGMIGFLLSPLSWWNDLFVNVPLAAAFAWGVSLFYRPAFEVSLVVGYWLTNILGLVLLHKGAHEVLIDKPTSYGPRALVKDVIVSTVYTLVIVGLVKWKILTPLPKL